MELVGMLLCGVVLLCSGCISQDLIAPSPPPSSRIPRSTETGQSGFERIGGDEEFGELTLVRLSMGLQEQQCLAHYSRTRSVTMLSCLLLLLLFSFLI